MKRNHREGVAPRAPGTPVKSKIQTFSDITDGTKRKDLLRRFISTPYAIELRLMHRTVRLETNCEAVLALTLKSFGRHQHGRTKQPEFVWRIVCESDPHVHSTAVRLSAFADRGIQYINIGQRGFLAVDFERREAVGFLADRFFEDEPRFRHRPPLDILLSMTAASLGLTALSGSCVGMKDRGAMIFGPPNSGKTTAGYLAAKQGMEFHADQVVFLDMRRNLLRAWGDPFPAVFRPDTLDFLPELRQSAHRSTYADLSFYYFDKSPLQPRRASPVAPVCNLFLNRDAADAKCEPRLKQISQDDAAFRLRKCALFNEDKRFDAQMTAALDALVQVPVFELQYGRDPAIAAAFIKGLLQ
jgi:hypothetical protein